ncbi:MAG: exodeoxyribonuclease VII large subunit [Candidatus Methanomethylophilus sp.]|jgi:exodeoxyribonuclease VII large subunit|nr:exodeoxyribonuclease VII large subunit [Methanomethylophilus sp.]MCI2074140.1 exodeoxyribonuclease VII large subunit [Methanomethylophilus sp.]MCI2093063.1 exodeoxyribonuclease VII large subunit [Methanomethylophilus sp.]
MAERLTVTQLNERVHSMLSSSKDLNGVWLLGEISGLKRSPQGHYYFTVKDQGSNIPAALFRGSRSRIDFEPADSMKVEAFGHVDLYVPYGRYQFIVETMKRSGIGELYQKYEELRKKLDSEGLFSRPKRPLPRYPKVIGVVTSPTGAVIHDIIVTTGRRYPADILLAPVQVQGEGAAEDIVRGIELINRVGADVLIVGRGGGSIEDLWAFNEEPVVRAIAASRIPVISSVGHETDTTLADFAADVRAATPTAAAELAVRDKSEILRELEDDAARLSKAIQMKLGHMESDLGLLNAKLDPGRMEERTAMLGLKIDELASRCARALSQKVADMRRRLSDADAALRPALAAETAAKRKMLTDLCGGIDRDMSSALAGARLRLESLSARAAPAGRKALDAASALLSGTSAKLDALNPYSVLDRGYSIVTSANGRAVSSVRDIETGSSVTIRMRDGRAEAEITRKEESI